MKFINVYSQDSPSAGKFEKKNLFLLANISLILLDSFI